MKYPEKVYLLKYNGNGYGDGYGYGNGNGNGYGDGNGNGDGYGNGNGYGDGNGNGDGYGNGYGDGYGYGNGNGNGDGNGNGYGNGNGNGYGNGNGNGYGDGNGNGYGYGDGNGYGYGDGDGDGDGDGAYKAKIFGEWFEVSGELENSLCNNLPEHLYDKVDKGFLQRVTNLESLRSLREKIGLERYIRLFDAKIVNEEVDHQGNKMKLYQYDEKGEKVLILEVVCPSTDRMFHLHPVNQKAKTCFEAKASTFGNKPIAYRHGDVALFKVDAGIITIPFSET